LRACLQVSVRKVGLVALCSMLEYFPLEPMLNNAWVRAALPAVRDAETSIQELLLDWAEAFLIARSATAASAGDEGGRGGRDAANRAATAALATDDLKALLAAVGMLGKPAAACITHVCKMLASRKRLNSKAGAQGLEAILAGEQLWARCSMSLVLGVAVCLVYAQESRNCANQASHGNKTRSASAKEGCPLACVQML